MLWKPSIAIGLILTSASMLAAQDTGDYFADGKLTQPLHVKDVQGGFAGFTGWSWKVQPDGSWTKYQVFNRRLTPKGKGKLSAAQLKALAGDLTKFEALKLKNTGRANVNPHVITVEFGKHTAILTLSAGALLPKASTNTLEGRYGGIVRAVQALGKKGA